MDSSTHESTTWTSSERVEQLDPLTRYNIITNTDRRATSQGRGAEYASKRRYDAGINTTANTTIGNGLAVDDESAAVAPAINTVTARDKSSATLLDVVLHVSTRMHDREEGTRQLGLCVRCGRSEGTQSGSSRVVAVRLTDPLDPFFLFELQLHETDYAAFKQRLELLVDFGGFPRFLVSMIQGIVQGVSPFHVSFAVNSSDASRGTLRIIETTEFKTVEHMALQFLRQGDVGQKMYLAERFQHFERALAVSEAARREESAKATETIENLQRRVSELTEENRRTKENLRLSTAHSEKSQLSTLSSLREGHAKELATMRSGYDEKLRASQDAATEVQRGLLEDARAKDALIQVLREKLSNAESELATLRSQHRISEDTTKAQQSELERLRETNTELMNFKIEATKAMSENELSYVSITERLRGVTNSLNNKERELEALRDQFQKQDGYVHILAEQNEQLAEQQRNSERNLDKAHHIIGNQLQTIRNAKERYHAAADQLRSLDALLQEKQASLDRAREELATSASKAADSQRKITELREQLDKTDRARDLLAQELKQSQTALLHLQRSTSINGRHWGILGGGGAVGAGGSLGYSPSPGAASVSSYGISASAPRNSASPSVDLHREFARNATYTSGVAATAAVVGNGAVGSQLRQYEQPLFASSASVEKARAGSAMRNDAAPADKERSVSQLGMTEPKAVQLVNADVSSRQSSMGVTEKASQRQLLATRSFLDNAAATTVAVGGTSSAYF